MAQLNFVKIDGGVSQANVGLGAFLIGDDLEELMSRAKINRETMVDKGLQFVRKTHAKGQYYFVNNKTDKAFEGWVKLGGNAAKAVAMYNPMTEVLGMGKFNAQTNEIYLQLATGESTILETYQTTVTGAAYPYWKQKGESQELTGNWKINFLEGGPTLPKMIETRSLGSWTTLGEEYQNFSGTAAYSLDFAKPTTVAEGYWLNLGKVAESASIVLNGKPLGTLLGPNYQVFVPASAFKAQNSLVVKVSNSMANRVIALEKSGTVWQKFYNINISARFKQNLGKEGYFTTQNWQPKDAGLLEKVMLIPVESFK
jgi:hypothetical protein